MAAARQAPEALENKSLRRFDNARNVGAAKWSAGWSSLVARQAHNLKVVGSNPTPATISAQGSYLGINGLRRSSLKSLRSYHKLWQATT